MKRRVLGGLFWQGGTSILARGTRYIAVLILGRLLSPADFGAFASLYVLVEGLFLLSGMGLGEALVVRHQAEPETEDVTFLLAVLLGIASYAAAWLAAPAVESFYQLPGGAGLFRVLALVLVIQGFRVVPMRLFERAFNFRAKLLPTLAGALGYLVVAVTLAIRGQAVWSFVIALLASALAETVTFWVRSPWRPRWRWNWAVARKALAFGVPVVLGGVWIYLFGTVDRVVLARWGGAEMLGRYAFAYSLAALPATLGATIVGGVLLPSYGLLASDPPRRLALHLRVASVTAGGAVLFAILATFLSRDALRLAYGTKWDAAVPALQVLAAGSVFRSLVILVGDLLVGSGHPRLYQGMNVIQLMIACVAVPLALPRGGAVGVAVAMSLASLAALLCGWTLAAARLGAPFLAFPGCLAKPLAAGVVGALATLAARAAPAPGNALSLAAGALVGILGFGTAWWFLDGALRADVRRVLAMRRGA